MTDKLALGCALRSDEDLPFTIRDRDGNTVCSLDADRFHAMVNEFQRMYELGTAVLQIDQKPFGSVDPTPNAVKAKGPRPKRIGKSSPQR